MSFPTLPNYVDRGGLGVYPQPVLCENAELYVFLLKGKTDNLRRLCQTFLTGPSAGAFDCQPVVPYLLMTIATMPALRSGLASYDDRGTLVEREATFWILVRRSDGELAWFVPYIIVDNPVALSAGREIYGLPKQFGRFEIPPSPTRIDRILVEAMSFEQYASGATAAMHPLLTMTASGHGLLEELGDLVQDAERGFSFLLKQLTRDLGAIGEDLATFVEHVRSLFHPRLPDARIVMLKQFRDISDGTRACYQAIVETTATVTDSHFRLVPRLELKVGNLESHPISSDLGIDPQTRMLPGLWVRTNMVLGNGREIWRHQR